MQFFKSQFEKARSGWQFPFADKAGESLKTIRARRWLQTALLAWGILAVALCIKVLAEGNKHSVYGAFVRGPRAWWANSEMYDTRGYYYSPTFAVLFTPFAVLPDRVGQMLWGLVSVGALVWSLRMFYRRVLPKHWPGEAEAIFLLLTMAGALRGIWSLQSNALILACVLFASAAIVQARWWRASWWLAGPVYIKLWPIVAASLLGIQWPKKLIGPLAVACLTFGAIPFLTKP
ncbi:MAG TPA: glycosyltransferase family 87 protein, partial [Pirellulales bacterium]